MDNVINITDEEQLASKTRQTKLVSKQELFDVIKLAKKHTEPGPDGVRIELIKWLPDDNKKALSNLFNNWWKEGIAPEEFDHARVATIYKKGDTDIASKYRPISFLSIFYTTYMILIRSRIQREVDQHISRTQHGLRQGKATSHAIYLIRRIQEYSGSEY